MQKDWSEILQLSRIDGVQSRKKYAGCAQAHINAIMMGFKDPSAEFCIVLEDDVMPDGLTKETLTQFLDSSKHLFPYLDAISMCPTFDRDLTSTDYFYVAPGPLLIINPTALISGTAFMIYTRRIVSKLGAYQDHISRYPWIIPNDRLFTTDSYGFFSFLPLTVGIPLTYQSKLSNLAQVSDNFSGGMDVSHEKLQRLVHQSLQRNRAFHSNSTFYIYPKTHVLASLVILVCILFALLLNGLNRILQF